MATIKPFRAVRPRKDLAEKIAALPYDVYSSKEARKVVEKNPMSFLAIDRPETFFPEGMDLYAPEVYQKAKKEMEERVERGEFLEDPTPCYYLY